MSESNDNIEVSDELAALIAAANSGEELPDDDAPVTQPEASTPPETPAPETPAPETPATPPPVSTDVPEWAADMSDEDRAATAQRLIDSLPQDKRGSVPAIQQTAQAAQQYGAQTAAQQLQSQQLQSQRDQALEQSATSFADDLRQALVVGDTSFDIDTRTNEVIQAAQNQYHDTLATDIEQGLLRSLNRLGLQEIPQNYVQAIGAATSYGGVIQAYADMAADRGFELGRIAERNDASKNQAVDEKAGVNRLANQAIAKAAKDGRVRIGKDDEGYFYELVQDTPPSMGGGAVSGNAGAELSQEEFDALVNGDADSYDRFMEDPANRERWNRTLAAAARRG